MFKKLGLAVAAFGASVVVLHLSGLTSYTATAWSNIAKNCKKTIPIEFQVERLRHEVAQLVPDMKTHFNKIAEEMVAVENLEKDVVQTQANLKQRKENIVSMTKDLESGARFVSYDGKRYPSERIREKLARDFATFQACETELKTKEQLLEARRRALDTAQEQLAALKSQKQELEIQVAQIETELKTVRLAQTRSNIQVDDSQLARCKATLAEIKDRLNVEKKLNILTHSEDPIPVEKKDVSTEDLIKKVRSHLNDAPKADGSVAEKD